MVHQHVHVIREQPGAVLGDDAGDGVDVPDGDVPLGQGVTDRGMGVGEAGGRHHPPGRLGSEPSAVLQPRRRSEGSVGFPGSLAVPQPGEAQHLGRQPFLDADQLDQAHREGMAGPLLPVLTGQVGYRGFDSLNRVASVIEVGVVPFHHVEHMFCIMSPGYDKNRAHGPDLAIWDRTLASSYLAVHTAEYGDRTTHDFASSGRCGPSRP